MKNNAQAFITTFALLIITAVGLVIVLNYNGMVKAEKSVELARAQIESVLQRRLDLIPNLVESVKGYAAHEQETLKQVVAARNNAIGALKTLEQKPADTDDDIFMRIAQSQAALSSALGKLFALVENYPDLKASQNFLALQDQIEGTENRINVARQRYNATAAYYNSKIETFPGVFLAPLFGFGEKPYYLAEERAAKNVQVKF